MQKFARSAAVFVVAFTFLSLSAHAADPGKIPINKEGPSYLTIVAAKTGENYVPASKLAESFQKIAAKFTHEKLVGFQVDQKTGVLTIALNDNSGAFASPTKVALPISDCLNNNTRYEISLKDPALRTALNPLLVAWTESRYQDYHFKDRVGKLIVGDSVTEVRLEPR